MLQFLYPVPMLNIFDTPLTLDMYFVTISSPRLKLSPTNRPCLGSYIVVKLLLWRDQGQYCYKKIRDDAI